MANISKVTINDFSAGMQTSNRSSAGANIIKNFDIYDDPHKLTPLPTWERFNTDEEKGLGIIALGGRSQASEEVLGLGNGITNWFSRDWQYRVKLRTQTPQALNLPRQEVGDLPVIFGEQNGSGAKNDLAQPFTAVETFIDGFVVYRENGTDPLNDVSGTIHFELQIDVAGEPSGVALASSEIFSADYQGGSTDDWIGQWAAFERETKAMIDVQYDSLTPGLNYWMVLKSTSDADVPYLGVEGREALPGEAVAKTFNTTNGWQDTSQVIRFQAGFAGIEANSPSYGFIDLANMPSEFWTNVKADGGDIRVTDGDHESLVQNLTKFDQGAETGTIVFRAVNMTNQDFYVYYGNPDATEVSTYTDILGSAVEQGYPMDGNLIDYGDIGTNLDDDDPYTPSLFVPLIGQGLGNGDYGIDNGTGPAYDGNGFTMEFWHYTNSYPDAQERFATDTDALDIRINSDGTVNFLVQLVSNGTYQLTSNNPLPKGQWNHIFMVYRDFPGSDRDGGHIIINGVRDGIVNFNVSFGDMDGSQGNFKFSPNGDAGGASSTMGTTGAEFLMMEESPSAIREDRPRTVYSMVANNTRAFSFGTEEDVNNIVFEFDGAQLYEKDLTDNSWTDYLQGGLPVKDLEHFPMPAFINGTTPQFITTTNQSFKDEGIAFMWLSDLSGGDIDFNGDSLTIFGPNFESMPRSATGADKVRYLTEGQAFVSQQSPYVDGVFSTFSTANHLTPYGQYMAIASDTNNQSYVQLWDLDSTTATEFIDFGFGQIRAVGNIYGTLFGCINTDLDEGALANDERSLDIRVWTGGSFATPFYSMKSAVSFQGENEFGYQQPILNQVEYVDDGFVFFAKTADLDSEIHQGIWKVGKNEVSQQFGVSIPYATDNQGVGDFIYRTGQVILMINRDGEIYKVSDDNFTHASKWESNFFAGSDRENLDKLKAVEVTFEPLESGQTISVYFKKEGESGWTLLDDESTEGVRGLEILKGQELKNMPAFQEIQFKIESTGGKAAITSFEFTYEDTLNKSN